jgi:hypothetical protein
MKALGFGANDTKLAFELGDRNGDGKLDFEEFVQLFTIAWAHRETRDAFADGFGRDMAEVISSVVPSPDAGANAVGGGGSGGGGGGSGGTSGDSGTAGGAGGASSPGGETERSRAADGDDRVSTAFPFALVANSHRITKLVDACNPIIRGMRRTYLAAATFLSLSLSLSLSASRTSLSHHHHMHAPLLWPCLAAEMQGKRRQPRGSPGRRQQQLPSIDPSMRPSATATGSGDAPATPAPTSAVPAESADKGPSTHLSDEALAFTDVHRRHSMQALAEWKQHRRSILGYSRND